MQARISGLVVFVVGMIAGGGLLAWLTQYGSIAAAQQAANQTQAVVNHPPRFDFYPHTWLKLRGADETDFTDKTKKVGYEILHDNYSENVVYILSETGAIAAAPSPPDYKLYMVGYGNSFATYRLEPTTGRTWEWISNYAWTELGEKQPIPNGVYELSTVVFGDGKKTDVLRINQNTGETYYLDKDDVWTLLAEPAKK